MDAVFLKILNLGVSASFLMITVFFLRFALRKTPKWMICMLWGLVAVRLACPFTIKIALSVVPKRPLHLETGEESAPFPANAAANSPDTTGIETTTVKDVPKKNGKDGMLYAATAPQPDTKIDIFSIFSMIWAAGVVLMVVYYIAGYCKLYRLTRVSMALYENVLICDGIDAPFVFGILRPRIYLPSGLKGTQVKYVVAHEKAHIARLDHLWKTIGFFLLSIYWFHPFCWISYLLFNRDIESACDEHVVRTFNLQDKKNYANALLTYSIKPKTITASPLSFGGNGAAKRIRAVLRYKKPAIWVILTSLAVCIVTAACFLTDPASESKADAGSISREADARVPHNKTKPAPSIKDGNKANTTSGENSNKTNAASGKNSNNANAASGEEKEPKIDVVDRFMDIDWEKVEKLRFTGDDITNPTDIVCIGELPKHDIKIYGYNDKEVCLHGVAIEMKGDVNYFDWAYTSPRRILPDLYWDEPRGQLQIAFHIYSGTGVDASSLYVLQRYDTGTLRPHLFDLDDYRAQLEKRIGYRFDEKSKVLTLTDLKTKKELASAKLPYGNITGIELGLISSFQLGSSITYQVTPGYHVDGSAMPQYDDMPTLEFDVNLNVDENEDITFELGNARKKL